MEGMIWGDWFAPGECAPSMRPLEPAPWTEPPHEPGEPPPDDATVSILCPSHRQP